MFYIGRRIQITSGSFKGYEATIISEHGSHSWTVRLAHSGGYRTVAEKDMKSS